MTEIRLHRRAADDTWRVCSFVEQILRHIECAQSVGAQRARAASAARARVYGIMNESGRTHTTGGVRIFAI